jgi:hypothetical protein
MAVSTKRLAAQELHESETALQVRLVCCCYVIVFGLAFCGSVVTHLCSTAAGCAGTAGERERETPLQVITHCNTVAAAAVSSFRLTLRSWLTWCLS